MTPDSAEPVVAADGVFCCSDTRGPEGDARTPAPPSRVQPTMRPQLEPTSRGVGLRAPHVAEVLSRHPAVDWLEVHAENYMGGGPSLRALEAIRGQYPVAIHGVGLSLGSVEGVDEHHLARLAALVERIQPALVSEHLSWSTVHGTYLNHLLPLPYTEETLAVVIAGVGRVQDVLGRRLLVENPSSYLSFAHGSMSEPEFLNELARRSGCGVLCDVNNVYVAGRNLGHDPAAWLDALDPTTVGEIHLAGHAVNDADGQPILIDDHGSRVSEDVWRLYARALARFGPAPTLVEWDTALPPLDVLLEETARAGELLIATRRGGHDARAA
jgi:uncharacterized protein (UPF0276 family)